MESSLQKFFAQAIERSVADLIEAFERVPEDKRGWTPMGDARTALDQVAEVALLNGSTMQILQQHKWPEDADLSQYAAVKSGLAEKGWESIKPMLQENTSNVISLLLTIPDKDLSVEVEMPWGDKMTLAQIMSYPYWNTCYHEGQINYIASMLGCLG